MNFSHRQRAIFHTEIITFVTDFLSELAPPISGASRPKGFWEHSKRRLIRRLGSHQIRKLIIDWLGTQRIFILGFFRLNQFNVCFSHLFDSKFHGGAVNLHSLFKKYLIWRTIVLAHWVFYLIIMGFWMVSFCFPGMLLEQPHSNVIPGAKIVFIAQWNSNFHLSFRL